MWRPRGNEYQRIGSRDVGGVVQLQLHLPSQDIVDLVAAVHVPCGPGLPGRRAARDDKAGFQVGQHLVVETAAVQRVDVKLADVLHDAPDRWLGWVALTHRYPDGWPRACRRRGSHG